METTKVAEMADLDRLAAGRQAARADAFRDLADRHLDSSYRLAHVILGQRAEAEDATHDAFVMAWRNWGSLRDPSLFEHWFDRIVINVCRNRLRQARRWRTQDLSAELPVATTDAFGAVHDQGLIWPAIALLRADQRIVVALRFYRDLSIDEIAFRLGTRPGTVKSRLHRAIRDLRTILDLADPKRTLR